MERSYAEEIRQLELGAGQVFRGEGILAVTKALLQSGVAYVGGYQGAPVTALLDVLVSAKDMIGRLGVHVEACANEASAAAMLAAEYEQYGHAAGRLLAAAEHSPAMAAMAAHGRREHRRWLVSTFADHLPTSQAARRWTGKVSLA